MPPERKWDQTNTGLTWSGENTRERVIHRVALIMQPKHKR